MQAWRTESSERPEVLSKRNLSLAFGIHAAFFLLLLLYSVCHFKNEEKIIPIDLTVVVNENLDGKEDEPPPLDTPPPPPKPKPKPQPKPKPVVKEPEKPKELEQLVTNIVAKVDKKEEKKKEKEKKKEPPKKEEPKKEEPKKTKEELRKERLERMRNSAKDTKVKPKIIVKNQPSGDGRTDRKILSDAEIRKMLNAGYKAGKANQLAASEEQLGYSLIKMAFEKKWDKPPWTDTLRPMTIRVWFGPGGRIMRYKLETSSGDRSADRSIETAAARVGSVPNLPTAFIDKYKTSGVPVRFTVKPQ